MIKVALLILQLGFVLLVQEAVHYNRGYFAQIKQVALVQKPHQNVASYYYQLEIESAGSTLNRHYYFLAM
jgi:hypothetical protein